MGRREERYMRRRLRMAYFTSVLSIALVLFVLGVIGTLGLSGRKLANHVREKLKLQVVLNFDATEGDVQSVQQWLDAAPFVKSTQAISSDQALSEFEKMTGERPLEILDENPLPSSIEVTLKPEYANNDSIEGTADAVGIESLILQENADKVYRVYKDSGMINEVNNNIGKISYILAGISLLLAAIMIALINNTIRLAIYAKRFLIKTMQLVGATGGFIRRPFLYNGLLQGMVAGFLAILALSGFAYWMTRQLPEELFTVDDFALFGMLFLGVLLAGLAITFTSTFLAVRKFLRLKMDELY